VVRVLFERLIPVEQIPHAVTIQARMPERSFGRTVRYRRTRIGLSQAQLGELVGRSASSIRSWERDVSTPTDPSVLTALSAILDIDGRALFDKAGVTTPAVETHPTVEESLASLAPLPLEEPIEETIEPDPLIASTAAVAAVEARLDADSELEAEVQEHLPPEPEWEDELTREPEPAIDTFYLPPDREPQPEPVRAVQMSSSTEPAYVSPPEPYLITAPTPPVVDPSYMEDDSQRQMYRVRNLATVVLVVALTILLLWSLGNAVEAVGTWWEEFTNTLRL
jgi:transcriptional regulator with XRE-family HTH domain